MRLTLHNTPQIISNSNALGVLAIRQLNGLFLPSQLLHVIVGKLSKEDFDP